jgi:hypothetical protein
MFSLDKNIPHDTHYLVEICFYSLPVPSEGKKKLCFTLPHYLDVKQHSSETNAKNWFKLVFANS